MKPKMSTCPTGVSGAIRMIANGKNVVISRTVRLRPTTSLCLRVPPVEVIKNVIRTTIGQLLKFTLLDLCRQLAQLIG